MRWVSRDPALTVNVLPELQDRRRGAACPILDRDLHLKRSRPPLLWRARLVKFPPNDALGAAARRQSIIPAGLVCNASARVLPSGCLARLLAHIDPLRSKVGLDCARLRRPLGHLNLVLRRSRRDGTISGTRRDVVRPRSTLLPDERALVRVLVAWLVRHPHFYPESRSSVAPLFLVLHDPYVGVLHLATALCNFLGLVLVLQVPRLFFVVPLVQPRKLIVIFFSCIQAELAPLFLVLHDPYVGVLHLATALCNFLGLVLVLQVPRLFFVVPLVQPRKLIVIFFSCIQANSPNSSRRAEFGEVVPDPPSE